MELNINSPAYFAVHYGVDDEVYRFCQRAYLFFKDKEYSEVLHTIGIVPIVAPQELYATDAWKECCSWRGYNSAVAINIRMDFEVYYHAGSEEKVRLTRELILKAVKKVKAKGKFDYERFVEDFKLLE